MDDEQTTAVTLVTLEQDQVEDWFATIVETYDEVADADDVWESFTERFPTAAGSTFGSATATAWVERMEQLSTDPGGLLAELAEERDELAETYRAQLEGEEEEEAEAEPFAEESADYAEESAATQAEPFAEEGAGWAEESAGGEAELFAAEQAGWGEESAAAEASEDRFAWLSGQPELAARVETTLQYRPEHYESHLGPYLEQLWGAGWEQHPAEHKQAWLDQALAGLESASTQGVATEETAEPAQTAPTDEGEAAAEAEEAGALAEVEQQVAAALSEALAEVPEAAELSDEEIAEVLAEVLAEQAAAESA